MYNAPQEKINPQVHPEIYVEWNGKKTKLIPRKWVEIREPLSFKEKSLIFVAIIAIIFSCAGFLISSSMLYVALKNKGSNIYETAIK